MIMPETIPDKAMFRPDELAALFSVPRHRVYLWAKLGKMHYIKPGFRLIRVPHEEVLRFIADGGKGFVNNGKRAVTARMVAALRVRINHMVRGNVKAATSMKLLGCTQEFFRNHMEERFKPGMTWENYGNDGWVIDHIIPVAHFDMADPDHQRVCFHYTNLQPLWHIENIQKGKKYTRSNIRKVIRISHAIS